MKKLLLSFLISLLSLFSFGVLNTSAVSYNGSATHNFPAFLSSTGINVYYFDTVPYYTYYSASGSSAFYQNTIYMRGTSGLAYSGSIATIFNCTSCVNGSEMFYNYITYNSSLDRLYFNFWSRQYDGSFSNTGNATFRSALTITDFRMNNSCSGLSSDCLYYIQLTYNTSSFGTYLTNTRVYEYFSGGTLLGILDIPDDLLVSPFKTNFGNNDQGLLTGFPSLTGATFRYVYQPINNSFLSTDYFGKWLDSTDPNNKFANPKGLQYYGGTGSIFTTGGTITGSTNTGSIFVDCSSFLDVGCYIGAIWDTVVSWFFPDLNFYGNTSTCLSGSTSGFTGSSLDIEYMQKLVNFFALVSPAPPIEGANICTFSDGQVQMRYRRYSTGSYVNPTITNTPSSFNGWDKFFILVCSVFVVFFIIAINHNKHD